MRGNPVGRRFSNVISDPSTGRSLFLSSSPFSTSSGSSGRGRGRGLGPTQFDFSARAPGRPDSDDSKPDSPESPPGGFGRGRGVPDSSIYPPFLDFISSLKASQSGVGRGRGRGNIESELSRPNESKHESVPPKTQFTQSVSSKTQFTPSGEPNLPSSVQSALSGVGRGKQDQPSVPTPQKEENRHLRVRPRPKPRTIGEEAEPAQARIQHKISRESDVSGRGVGPFRARGGFAGGRGRGRGRGFGRGRGREQWERRGVEDSEEGYAAGLFLGDNADGEKLAERVGVENMNKLIEGFEEMSGRVLPSPMEDAYLDALHTNYMIEFEPEYLMGEFDQNPDIDEKPPMPLRDVLEKVKPFIMAYEGIQSQEEWKEVVEETMKNVPLLKEIVDYYSGPDRVTAKRQQEELERVAKTIPASTPASVKQFTDRAVLSLQSNPGWGFNKKCQFMDKLVREVNQCYN